MSKYKLISLDMDGTLLDDNKKISSQTLNVLHLLQKEGKNIVIATGRPYKGYLLYHDILSLNSYVVCYNGAMIFNQNNEVIYSQEMDINESKLICKLLIDNNLEFCIWSKDNLYINKNSYYLEKYLTVSKVKPIIVDDFNFILEDGITKFLVPNEENVLKEFNLKIEKLNLKESQYFFSTKNFFEITSNKVSKKNAIESLCKLLDIKQEEVIAFGDEENDLSLIKWAGFSIAMGNAIFKVKHEADYITLSNNEDGVRLVLEKYVLNN